MAGGALSADKPWLDDGEVLTSGTEADTRSIIEKSPTLKRKAETAQSVVDYLANESKLVPAGILGAAPETIGNILKLGQAGLGTAYTGATGQAAPEALNTEWPVRGGIADVANLFGYKPMSAPGNVSELGGDILKGAGYGGASGSPIGAIAGAISGAGQDIARHLYPDNPAAEITGGMVPGLAVPAFAAARVNLAKNLLNKESQQAFIDKNLPAVQEAVKNKVVRDMAAELSKEPLAEQNIQQAQKLIAQLPGVKMDIGQESQSGATVQRAKAAFRYSPAAVVEKQAIDEANRVALTAALPKGEAPQVPFERLLSSQQKMIAGAQQGVEAATTEAERIGAMGRMTPEKLMDAGQALKATRTAEKSKADAEVAIRSSKVDQAAGDTQFPIGGVVSEAERILGAPILQFDAANAPRVVGKLKEVLTKTQGAQAPQLVGPDGRPIGGTQGVAPAAVGIQDLRAMREAVNQDIADVANSTTGVDRRQFRALTQIKQAIDGAVEQAGNPQAAQAYHDFNKYYATEYAPRFLRGENIKQTLKTPLGVEAVPDENVIGTYLKPGAAAPMRRFVSLYGDSPPSMKLMEDALYDRYAKDVIKNGVVDDKAHSKFMFNYGAQLKQMGAQGAEIQRTLAGKGTATSAILEHQASLTESLDKLKNDSFINALHDKYGARPVDAVMKDATRDPRVMANLTSRMNQNEAQGLVNWFADDIGSTISGAGYGKMGEAVGAKLADKNYAAGYRIALDKAFGKEAADAHIKRLDAIQKIAGRLDATELDPFIGLRGEGAGTTSTSDALSKATGVTSRTVFSMLRAVATGRTSPEDVAFTLGSQFASHKLQQMSNEITRKLLTDPGMSEVVLEAMRNPPKSTGISSAAWALTKKVPSAIGFWLGADRYSALAGKAAPALIAPLLKQSAEQQGQP